MSAGLPVEIRGETLLLHPMRAVVWPRRDTVIVADTHFGKSGFFRRHGIATPAGSDEADRQRLNDLVSETGAARLIVLGDFLHAPFEPLDRDAQDLAAWIEALRPVEVVVVAGNHDRGAGGLSSSRLRWYDDELVEPPFRLIHDADRSAEGGADLFTLSGHIHPVARLSGLPKRSPRVPIFWQRSAGLVLPSFGLFTGGHVVRPLDGDRVFAVGPQRVVRFCQPRR